MRNTSGSNPDDASGRLRFNPHLVALPPYNAGMNIAVARRRSGRADIAALASNENPLGCSPRVFETLRSADFQPWRYSDPSCTALRAALAEKLAVSSKQIVVGNGSEEMIAAISRAMLMPRDTVVTVVPSFGLHEIEPLATGARIEKIAMTPELEFDVPALVAALRGGPRVAFLSTPSNPVGCSLSRDGLNRIVAATQGQTLLVIDEAYFEFAGADAPNAIEELRGSGIAHVVLRTFSKAYGLAGLRVGYALCSNPDIARVLAAAKTPFNVNLAAQTAALAALDDEAWMRATVADICCERRRLVDALSKIGLRPARSESNFVFVDCGISSDTVAEQLLAEGIIIKPWREPGYQTFIRATVGFPAENDRLINALSAIQSGRSPR